MEYQMDQAIAILRRTPQTLTALLRGLPEEWTSSTAGPDTWSVYDVVGHLLHGEETDWIARARIILEVGEGHPFESFDRMAMFQNYQGYSLDQLLDAFAEARAQNLATLDDWRLIPEQLSLKGTHPALGTVTLSQLLATWVARASPSARAMRCVRKRAASSSAHRSNSVASLSKTGLRSSSIVSSTEALCFDKVPQHLIVVDVNFFQ
jgi:hypothetical protein